MPFKPNFNFQRAERDRLKKEAKEAKLRDRRERKANEAKGEEPAGDLPESPPAEPVE